MTGAGARPASFRCYIPNAWPGWSPAIYNIQNIARSMEPASPPEEAALWYQYLFHNERGRRALERNRRGFARQLWAMWSPTWQFDDATFESSAASFDNPDFVDVVIHSYRHRYALVEGDPAYAAIEAKLAQQPPVRFPRLRSTATATASMPAPRIMRRKFEGFFERRVFAGAGHNLPQERPAEWAQAVMDVRKAAAEGTLIFAIAGTFRRRRRPILSCALRSPGR